MAEECGDRVQYWEDSWAQGRKGFHLPEPNDMLVKHLEVLRENESLPPPKRILVPLCGKTVDVPFLAGQEWVDVVVGTEGVDQAVEEFSAEQPDLQMSWGEEESTGAFRKMSSADGRVQLLVGDHFLLAEEATGEFHAVYDRASLVAILPELREQYVDIMYDVLKPNGHILLVTLERRRGTSEGVAAGPPFSVAEDTVRALYEKDERFEVNLLEDRNIDLDSEMQKFKAGGVEELHELAFFVRKKS